MSSRKKSAVLGLGTHLSYRPGCTELGFTFSGWKMATYEIGFRVQSHLVYKTEKMWVGMASVIIII